jgi:hypothetical protein
MSDLWSFLRSELVAQGVGLHVLFDLFSPFIIIVPAVRYWLSKQTGGDEFSRKRSSSFIKWLSVLLFVILEAPYLYGSELNLYSGLLWIGSISLCILMVKFPEQIQYLSLIPDSLLDPITRRVAGPLRKVVFRTKGFLTSIVRGDQLDSPRARKMIGIAGDTFRCYRCRMDKAYPGEYGATLIVKGRRSHICADCVEALPQLKVEDLRKWL